MSGYDPFVLCVLLLLPVLLVLRVLILLWGQTRVGHTRSRSQPRCNPARRTRAPFARALRLLSHSLDAPLDGRRPVAPHSDVWDDGRRPGAHHSNVLGLFDARPSQAFAER